MATATWNFDENEVMAAAKQLGIKLTDAEFGSEVCEAWADRVLQARKHYDDGNRTSASWPLKTRTPTRFEP